MAGTGRSDADGIESAYESILGGLFKVLFENLTEEPNDSGDQGCVSRFIAGYNTAKRARQLALGVVGTATTPMIAAEAVITKKKAPKRPRR